MNTLIPNNLEIQVRVTFTDNERYFVCPADKRPRFQIQDAQLHLLCCILRPQAELAIAKTINANQLQIPFMGQVFKSFSVPTGVIQHEIDISLKDHYQNCCVILHRVSFFLIFL